MARFAILALVFVALASADFFSGSSYKAPYCLSRQACSIKSQNVLKFDMPNLRMCTCEASTCTDEFAVDMKGVTYSFCEPNLIEQCADGEVALTINGLQTILRCICTGNYELRKVESEQFVRKRSIFSLPDSIFQCVKA